MISSEVHCLQLCAGVVGWSLGDSLTVAASLVDVFVYLMLSSCSPRLTSFLSHNTFPTKPLHCHRSSVVSQTSKIPSRNPLTESARGKQPFSATGVQDESAWTRSQLVSLDISRLLPLPNLFFQADFASSREQYLILPPAETVGDQSHDVVVERGGSER